MKKIAQPSIDYEEFLNLAKSLVDEQYDANVNDYQEVLDRGQEQLEKYQQQEKIIQANSSNNATDLKQEKIRAAIENSGNLEIGKFTLKILRPEGTRSKEYQKLREGLLNISIYEKGLDKLHRKVKVAEDNRFKEAEWISYFKDPLRSGREVPIETVVEIVTWLQAIEKMLLFF